ncbi:MAG: IS1595 family transposase [Bacteroidetes bacterium]|nr:IS1595 family transposase [Bacteroidota bacterium]
MTYPKNQIEFEKMFATEEDCIKYIIALRWPEGFACPNCSKNVYWFASKNRIICAACEYQTTAIAGTVFEQTNKPLTIWFRAIWWMIAQKNGVSATGLQKILGLGSYRTAWTWLHKLRLLTVNPGREVLSGVVEIDETFIGGKAKGKRGRGAENKSIVVIAVEILEKGTGRVRLGIVPEASGRYLLKWIRMNVRQGSLIITDGWKGYNRLKQNGYEHRIEKVTVKDDDEEMLPNANRVASLLKRWLIGTHQNFTSRNRLISYLDEYVFRYNRRTSKSRGLLFKRVMEQAVLHKPVKYTEIMNVR